MADKAFAGGWGSPRVGPCIARMPVSSVCSLSGFLGPLLCKLQLCTANRRPVTNPGAMGVLHQLPVGCHRSAVAVAARFLLQLLCCTSLQPTPASLPIQGLWGCCSGCPLAAIVVLQQLQHVSCCSLCAATHCSQAPTAAGPAPLPIQGLWGCYGSCPSAATAPLQ